MNCFIRLTKCLLPIPYYLALPFFVISALSSLAFAQEMNLTKAPSKEKIHVTADSLTSESNAKVAEFKGNVKVTQGNFIIISDRLKIFYKESGEEKKAGTTESIDKIFAIGNVKIESEEATAFSEQAEYDTNTMIMVLTGENSRVLDKKNSVTGSRITFNRKDGLVKAEGDTKKRVNAVFFPDEKTTPGKETEKKKAVNPAAVKAIPTEKLKAEDKKGSPESTGKSPAPEKSLSTLREEKKPAIEAKADVKSQSAPVNVVFFPADVEKAKTVKPVIQKIEHGTLIKRIGIAPVENKTGNSSIDFQKDIHKQFSGILAQNCSGVRLFQEGDENFPADFIKPPRKASGSVDGFRICETGRKFGLSAIITGSVTSIKTGEEPRGILWYRDSHPFVSIFVHIDIYDPETGAKLLDETFNYRRDSDELEIESIREGKIDPVLLKDAFEHISKDAGRKICEIMKKQSWKGYVSSVSEDKIFISSGSNMGVVSGNVFEVYVNSLLEGKYGQKFYIPGSKAGLIKIIEVNNEYSEAVIITGDSVKAGYTIRP